MALANLRKTNVSILIFRALFYNILTYFNMKSFSVDNV